MSRFDSNFFDVGVSLRMLCSAGVAGKDAPPDWNTAVRRCLKAIADHPFEAKLQSFSSNELEAMFDNGKQVELAKAAMNMMWQEHTISSLQDILCSKQSDYGPRNILRFGEQGLQVRIWDKIARYNNLRSKEAKNESVIDTAVDIIGYTAILLMLRMGWFTLPLQLDLFREENYEQVQV